MRFLCILLFAFELAAAPEPAASARALAELGQWLEKPVSERPEPGGFARVPLTKADAERAATILWNDHLTNLRATRAQEMKEKAIRVGDKVMKFETVYFGSKENAPDGGRSLFISMHGGGGAPKAVNDSQWKNQVALSKTYAPAEGLYIAPRAPTDRWNLWHEAHIDALFDRLIENCVALEGVNPDRVYILGYSAGGDGVYQLAPRMADRWAAAAMMAGHPNETSPVGLRNVPFALQVGELDSAYSRNKIAGEWKKKLELLHEKDPGGYTHFVELHPGKPHWMGTDDRKAVPWMEKFTRHPLPDRIVWRQDDVTHERLYWLAVPKEGLRAGQEVIASREGQTFDITLQGPETVTVFLNDAMADLDRPVLLRVGGKEVFNGTVDRTIGTLLRTLAGRGDRRLMFTAKIP